MTPVKSQTPEFSHAGEPVVECLCGHNIYWVQDKKDIDRRIPVTHGGPHDGRRHMLTCPHRADFCTRRGKRRVVWKKNLK